MLKTERFRKRQDQLSQALHSSGLEALWKRYVRENLRTQPIVDLHDDYDFHLSLRNRVIALRESILAGNYQPRYPLRFRSEKKNGISRHLVVLRPADALALEAIGNHLDPIISRAQPTNRAYFSRNKRQPPSVDSVDETFDSPVFGYPWWVLWPKFQKRILEFSETKEITVITDVATYYDTIDFTQLRNFVVSLSEFSEVFLDFLFFMLDRFVWRPDYLPHPGRGMPQINLDCPRLLAHAFLFEADELLNEKTNGNFVRWLDDIDFGCDSKIEAKKIIGNLDELLFSRGLHLNASKTKILEKKEAFEYFQVKENRYLTLLGSRISRRLADGLPLVRETRLLRRRFSSFIGQEKKIGHYNKVIKRYITLFGKCGDKYLDPSITSFIFEEPDLRNDIFRYFQLTGWTQDREDIVVKYALTAIDDHGLFSALSLLMDWSPLSTVQYVQRMRELAVRFEKTSMQGFLANLWLLGKYGNEDQLDHFLSTTVAMWKTNEWLARQVAALYARLKMAKTKDLIKNVILRFGLLDAQSVLDNFELISLRDKKIFNSVRPYVLATKAKGVYPLSKTMICLSLITGKYSLSQRRAIQKEVLSKVRCGRTKQLILQAKI